MADETKGAAAGAEDPIKNLKEEFNRKLGNFDQKMSSLEQTNQALLAQLKSMAPAQPKPTKKENTLDQVWFDKPEEAAAEIVSRATASINKSLDERAAHAAKQQTTMAELVGDFPELANKSHDLTVAAVKIYDAMSDEDKRSPLSYKAAVKEAALDLGIKPMRKRSEEEQDFSLRGGSRSDSPSRKRGPEKLSAETEEFARIMGVDVDDPKVKERLVNKHGRKNYTRYA